MKLILGLFALVLVVAIGGKIATDYFKNNPSPFVKTPVIKIKNQQFKLYIAKTSQEKQIGLSQKKSIPQEYGMLFPFEKPDYHSFWMKNMQFPIDIIYIKSNKIVDIFSSVQPPAKPTDNIEIIKPSEPSDTVLEINQGLSKKYSFQKGDTVIIEN